MFYTFQISLHLHEGEQPVNPATIARGIARVINLALESDIAGAEQLDSRFGSVVVTPIAEDSRS